MRSGVELTRARGTTERRRRMLRAVAFIGMEGAPMAGGDGGTSLQCRCGGGEVRADGRSHREAAEVVALRREPERRDLRWWEPVRQTRRRWRRGGARAQTRNRVK
jgi:hypothetical protein